MDTYVLLEERQNQLAKAKEDLDQRVKTHKGDFSEKVDLDLPQLVTQRESISSHVSKVLKKKSVNTVIHGREIKCTVVVNCNADSRTSNIFQRDYKKQGIN
jgi:hypothetical protein